MAANSENYNINIPDREKSNPRTYLADTGETKI